MTYTVLKLITNAFYVSSIRSRDFNTVSGSDTENGLELLNEILADKNIELDMVPYYTTNESLTLVQGQEEYSIADVTDIETFTYFIDDVRYSSQPMTRDLYFGTARANNINSLPVTWHYERAKGGCNLFVYFWPDRAYNCQLICKKALSQVSINDDLSLVYDQFYISYLKYALAQRLCVDYNFDVPPGSNDKLLYYEQLIGARSGPFDLRQNLISTFDTSVSPNYAQANLGKGWTVFS